MEIADSIRKRKSYLMWKRILHAYGNGERELLEVVHAELNGRRGYGCRANAIYAEESLTQLLEDEGL